MVGEGILAVGEGILLPAVGEGILVLAVVEDSQVPLVSLGTLVQLLLVVGTFQFEEDMGWFREQHLGSSLADLHYQTKIVFTLHSKYFTKYIFL